MPSRELTFRRVALLAAVAVVAALVLGVTTPGEASTAAVPAGRLAVTLPLAHD